MTQEQRDKMLIDLSKAVVEIRNGMQEMDSKLTAKLEEQGKAMQEMDNRLTAELERQRKNMAAMEYNLSEKIDALFDAREISLENDQKQDKKFKSIENILEGHSLRISILESKLS